MEVCLRAHFRIRTKPAARSGLPVASGPVAAARGALYVAAPRAAAPCGLALQPRLAASDCGLALRGGRLARHDEV